MQFLFGLFAMLAGVAVYTLRDARYAPRRCLSWLLAAGAMALLAMWALGAASHQDWHCQHGPHASEVAKASACATVTHLIVAASVTLAGYAAVLVSLVLVARANRRRTA